MEALRQEGDQLHMVVGDIQNGLRGAAFLHRQRTRADSSPAPRFQLEMDRVQAGAQQDVGPLAHLRRFGITDNNPCQVVSSELTSVS